MFTHPAEVIAALRRCRDFYDPKTASVLLIGRGDPSPYDEPFHAGFLSTLEERTELLRRLAQLDARSRRLLVLWFVEGMQVVAIARKLQLSRVHCYRVQRAALAKLLDPETAETQAPAPVTA